MWNDAKLIYLQPRFKESSSFYIFAIESQVRKRYDVILKSHEFDGKIYPDIDTSVTKQAQFLLQSPAVCVHVCMYVVGSRRLMPPDALQPKAYCKTLVFSRSYLHRQVAPPETLVVKGGTTWARKGR